MKRGIIAIILMLLALGVGLTQYFYVTNNSKIYVKMLNSADEKIEQNDIYGAQSMIERIDHRFSGSTKTFDVFLSHEKVDEIYNNLAMLRCYANSGSNAEFLATSAKTKRELTSLYKSEIPTIDNIL